MLYLILDNGILQLWDEYGNLLAYNLQNIETIIDPCKMLYTGIPSKHEKTLYYE